MRAALLKSGAIETLDLMRADREPGEVWRRWLDVVSKHLGIAQGDVVTPAFDRPVTLTLASRVQLNDPNNPDVNDAWSLLFESAESLDFRAGDLLMVSPREGEPERAYSIGSSALVNPRQILLTVGLISRTDEQGNEQLGAMSGFGPPSARRDFIPLWHTVTPTDVLIPHPQLAESRRPTSDALCHFQTSAPQSSDLFDLLNRRLSQPRISNPGKPRTYRTAKQ